MYRFRILVGLGMMIIFPAIGQDAFVANLIGEDFGPGKRISCWNPNGTFNKNACQEKDTKCSFERISEAFQSTKLKFDLRLKDPRIKGSVNIHVAGIQKADYIELYQYNKEVKGEEFYPVGALLTIYKKEGGLEEIKKFSILKQIKVPETGIVSELLLRPTIHQVTFKLPPLEDKMANYYFEVLGTKEFLKKAVNEVTFFFSEGDFEIVIYKQLAGRAFEKFFLNLTVSADKSGSAFATNKIFEVQPKQFEYINQVFGENYLSWKTDGYKGKKLPALDISYSRENDRLYFKKIDNFNISALPNENLAKYFSISMGQAQVIPEKENEFVTLINKHPVYTMSIDGTCSEVKHLPQTKELSVMGMPDDNGKNLGRYVITYSPENEQIQTAFFDPQGGKHEVQVNLLQGRCRDEGVSALLHATREVHGSWVNLGKGPWGSKGWVKASYTHLSDIKWSFTLGGLRSVTFARAEDGLLLVKGSDLSRSETEVDEPGAESPEVNSEFKIEPSKLWDQEGNFKPNVDCSYGC